MLKVRHVKDGIELEQSNFKNIAEFEQHLKIHAESFQGFEHFITEVGDRKKDENDQFEAEQDLNKSDYKVLRHLREKYLNIKTTLTEVEFTELEMNRQNKAVLIDGIKKKPKELTETKYEIKDKKDK